MTATMSRLGPPAAPNGDDLMGRALAEWGVAGGPVFLRTRQGRRLRLDLSNYFAPVTPVETMRLDRAAGLVVDVGCGPARHARLLQGRGLPAVGLVAVSGWRLDPALTQGRRYWAWFRCVR